MFIEPLQMAEGNTIDILVECGHKWSLSKTKCLQNRRYFFKNHMMVSVYNMSKIFFPLFSCPQSLREKIISINIYMYVLMISKTSRLPVIYLHDQVWEAWGNARNYEWKESFWESKTLWIGVIWRFIEEIELKLHFWRWVKFRY